MEISDRLRAQRESLGYTQAEVASALGFERPFVSKIESGRVDVRLSTVIRYLDAIGATIELASTPVRTIRLSETVRIANQGRSKVLASRFGGSDPTARVEAKRRAGRDVSVERRAIDSR